MATDGGINWIQNASLVVAGVSVALLARLTLGPRLVQFAKPVVNLNRKQHPNSEKIVDQVFLEDLKDKKTYYCRCWRSNKFPHCDGSHTQHNKETGDNVGPLLILKKS